MTLTSPGSQKKELNFCVRGASVRGSQPWHKNRWIRVQFSPSQFKMASMRWERPICAPPRLSEISDLRKRKSLGCFSRQCVCWSCALMPACPGQHIHRSLPRWMSNSATLCQSGLLILLFSLCSNFVEASGNPAESIMCDSFHLHCQAGG